MMKEEWICQTMEEYVSSGEMSAGILIVHKKGQLLYHNRWGYTDSVQTKPVVEDTIFRMASMTKPLTAAGILKLCEQGELELEDEVRRFLPSFGRRRVVSDTRFGNLEDFLEGRIDVGTLSLEQVTTVTANRELTIRDILTHSSGLEMGVYGWLKRMRTDYMEDTLESRMEKLSEFALDFQPGTATGYSPTASFDLLARLIEIICQEPFDVYMEREIFRPLEMGNTAFHLTREQETRLIPLYKPVNGRQVDVSGTKEDIGGVAGIGPGYLSGAGGVYSTAQDYDHFTGMLCMEGSYKGKQILEPETVRLMHQERAYQYLEPEPGYEWGLGVKVRTDPVRGNSFATKGTYGWSGAFGTHFFVSPQEGLCATFVMNRADIEDLDLILAKRQKSWYLEFGENPRIKNRLVKGE